MALQVEYEKRTFAFAFDARTSRGKMADKISWFIKIFDTASPTCIGYGECGPLPGLSVDDRPDFETILQQVTIALQELNAAPGMNAFDVAAAVVPEGFPSIRFGIETALLDFLNGGKKIIYHNTFVEGRPIAINGLVWMGDRDFMMKQVHDKIEQGFTCIKIKIGGLDFKEECSILELIRSSYSPARVTLRLDANGAFDPQEALEKLKTLAKFSIHSIEQPIKPGLEAMQMICEKSPIPIALDEELIGKEKEKEALLRKIKPAYIILKPTLHGGLYHCQEWIQVAERLSIDWWITSALESNIGLNAICQFVGNYTNPLPQGLGTGALYLDNFPSPLEVVNGFIQYNEGAKYS